MFDKLILKRLIIPPGLILGVLFSAPSSEAKPVHIYSIIAYDENSGLLPNDDQFIKKIMSVGN